MKLCFLTPLARRGPWRTPEYGVGTWPLALGGDLFPYAEPDLAPLEAYDVLLLHTAMGHYGDALRVLDRFPKKPVVLMLTCDAMFIDPQGFFPCWKTPLKRLLDRACLALSETEETGFFQAMTTTPVAHLPLPLPLAAMREARDEGRESRGEGRGARVEGEETACGASSPPIRNPKSAIRNSSLVLLGSGFRAKKNGVATAMAFRRLRASEPSARALLFAEEPDAERTAYALWGVEGVDVRPATCDQPVYWRQAARCDLALHLDYRRTVGRFSGECAALGVPCISTASVTMQRTCFPELIVDPWDVEGAAVLAARVLRDPLFRGRVVARAAEAVAPFDLAPMAARLRALLRRYVL